MTLELVSSKFRFRVCKTLNAQSVTFLWTYFTFSHISGNLYPMSPVGEVTNVIPLVDLQAEFSKHGQATTSAMAEVAQSGSFILGPQVSELESSLSKYLHSEETSPVHVIGVSDGTAALQLCLMALDIGRGDEVITTPFTWISSAEVIPLVGATPIFADIEPDTYVLNTEHVAHLITKQTRAVIAVSLYGVVPDLPAMRKVLDSAECKWGTRIALIEDGAQSFGAVRNGDKSCASPHTTLSTTSFFPTKPLSCYGDGGAVFTRDPKLADCVRALRVHGKVGGQFVRVGLNSRLDTLQAAVLIAKWPVFPDMLIARRAVADRYNELLCNDSRVVIPTYQRIKQEDESICSSWGVYTVRIEQRDAVFKKLRDAGVATAVYYKTPCHLQPMFLDEKSEEGKKMVSLPEAERVASSVLSLPIHPYLDNSTQLRIVRELLKALDDLSISSPPH